MLIPFQDPTPPKFQSVVIYMFSPKHILVTALIALVVIVVVQKSATVQGWISKL